MTRTTAAGAAARAASRRRLAGLVALAIPVVATVATFGELTVQAFAVVLVAGALVAGVGLRRRAGSAAPAVGRAGLPWLSWLTALAGWELFTRLSAGRLPTLSDLADPLLAHPAARGAATLAWLAAGDWLVRRPTTRTRA